MLTVDFELGEEIVLFVEEIDDHVEFVAVCGTLQVEDVEVDLLHLRQHTVHSLALEQVVQSADLLRDVFLVRL